MAKLWDMSHFFVCFVTLVIQGDAMAKTTICRCTYINYYYTTMYNSYNIVCMVYVCIIQVCMCGPMGMYVHNTMSYSFSQKKGSQQLTVAKMVQ